MILFKNILVGRLQISVKNRGGIGVEPENDFNAPAGLARRSDGMAVRIPSMVVNEDHSETSED